MLALTTTSAVVSVAFETACLGGVLGVEVEGRLERHRHSNGAAGEQLVDDVLSVAFSTSSMTPPGVPASRSS